MNWRARLPLRLRAQVVSMFALKIQQWPNDVGDVHGILRLFDRRLRIECVNL